jgi:hypothetical protein
LRHGLWDIPKGSSAHPLAPSLTHWVLRGGAQSEDELTPAAVVAMLDRFIVGQPEAKRAMAVALRSRWRRRKIASAGLKVSARTICISVPCEAVLWDATRLPQRSSSLST